MRAAALPPAERRAAIIESSLPLLLAHGSSVTTRQLAEAAGVAEGTIFRVFADKDELIAAVVERVFDPVPTAEAVAAIDLDQPLEARLAAAVEILQRRVTDIWRLMTAVGMTKPPSAQRSAAELRSSPDMVALAGLFGPDADRLRREPMAAAELLRGLTFACSHPAMISADTPPAPAEIVSLLLDGIRRPGDAAPSPDSSLTRADARQERPC